MNKEELESIIEDYLVDKYKIKHSHIPNELHFGYISNRDYELGVVDIDELAKHILNKLNER